MPPRDKLIQANIRMLEQGHDLLHNKISGTTYCNDTHALFDSGVGKHMRHILNHFDCLLYCTDNHVDYDARQRDPHLETDRRFALEKITDLIATLNQLDAGPALTERSLMVRDHEGDGTWTSSSLGRELQYLFSHTVHHFAMIALVLRAQGVEPGKDFGVSPSTLRYRAVQTRQNYRISSTV